jgi:CRP/FNR family transcriptional regulator, cyclic AMP receptor protein
VIEGTDQIRQRSEMLEKTQWCSEFTWQDVALIAWYLSLSRTPRGMTIFPEGSLGQHMCILVDGRVNVVKEDGEGRKKVLATITKGKAFGEMTLFDGESRSASVVAEEPTTMLVLTRDKLQRLVEDHPRLGSKLLFKVGKIVSQRLRMTTGQLVDLI